MQKNTAVCGPSQVLSRWVTLGVTGPLLQAFHCSSLSLQLPTEPRKTEFNGDKGFPASLIGVEQMPGSPDHYRLLGGWSLSCPLQMPM